MDPYNITKEDLSNPEKPIQIDTLESEPEIQDPDKLDLDMDIMRLALGSEELLKNSTKTF